MSQRDNASCLESLEVFLEHSLQTSIIEGLISIREQANEISKSNHNPDPNNAVEVTKQLLKDVRNWTQVLLDDEVKRILNKIPFLQKLLTALFVMKVKVLSVINMRKDSEEFPLTIPANATFLHHVYIQCANLLIDNSNVIREMQLIDVSPLVKEGIRNACLACIEWSELLAWGLNGVNVNDVIQNIMKDDEVKSEDVDARTSGELDESVMNDDDNEFENIANNEKVYDKNQDDDIEDSNESLFDYSDENNSVVNSNVGESKKESTDEHNVEDTDSSVVGDSAGGDSVVEDSVVGDSASQVAASSSVDDAKHISSSSPSFF